MALEDAVILARALDCFEGSSMELAFKAYEATRKPRTSDVQAGSGANNWMRNATNPDWLYGHEVWSEPLKLTPEPAKA